MTGPGPIAPSHITMAAARKIAALKSVSWLLVETGGRLIGILDERALTGGRDDDLVSACMKTLRLSVHPATTVGHAYALAVERGLAWLPVVAGVFVVGAVSREQLERAFAGVSDCETGAAARVAA